MGRFTTRVELHGAIPKDYNNLHDNMENEGFSRTITSDDDIEYHLPEAEYNYENNNSTKNQVMDKAKAAAGLTNKKYSIIVTESIGRIWSGLEKVK